MHKLQSNLENIAESMPGNFYWKNREGQYLGCNDLLLRTLGFKEKSDIVGKKDQDLWPQEAQDFIEKDQKVIKAGKSFYFEDKVSLRNGKQMYFTVVKVPLRDENNNIIGVIGNSLDVTKHKKQDYSNANTDFKNHQSIEFFKPDSAISFTPREMECLFYTLRGKSAKGIGLILKISPKTVEFHLEHIKTKFNCRSKIELISKAMELGYLNKITPSIIVSLSKGVEV